MPLNYKDAEKAQDISFQEKIVYPEHLAGLEESRFISKGGEHEETIKYTTPTPGAIQSNGAIGGQGAEMPVLPRHRKAVERYFTRSENGE